MELQGKKINFLGDSITEAAGASCMEKGFVNQVAVKSGAICRNYGIGGTRIARQQTPSAEPRFDRDFPTRALEMDDDADIVAVFGGTNDYGHGDAPFGEDSDRTVDTFIGALHVLYRELIEKYPTARIVVLTPLHRLGETDPRGEGGRKAVAGKELKCYVEKIREVAEYYSLPVLDLYSVSGMQPAVPVIQQTYLPDGLHPNDAGAARLADTVIAFLKSL